MADPATLDELEATGRVVLRYADAHGDVTDAANPNGSDRGIAGSSTSAATSSASCRTPSARPSRRSAGPMACGSSARWNAGCMNGRQSRSVGYDRPERIARPQEGEPRMDQDQRDRTRPPEPEGRRTPPRRR